MRVFVSQLFHEASSFVLKVNINDFRTRYYLKGKEAVKARFEHDRDWMAGALLPFSEDDLDIGVCTACVPAGMIEYESFMEIINDMLHTYEKYLEDGPPDVLMLLLHGANLVDNLKDPDGYLVNRFRELSGIDTTIGVTLDFHANISERLVNIADIVVVGIEYPHVDTYSRGKFASELAKSLKNLKSYRFPIPIITGLPMQATVPGLPFYTLINFVDHIKKKYNIVDLAIAGGFAFGDCYDMGMSLIAINDGYEGCVDAFKEIKQKVWDLKESMLKPIPEIEDVWPIIEKKAKLGRVVVADVSDSPGSGGKADETHVLSRLLKSSNFVSAFHVDPTVVKQASIIGIGNDGSFTFGTSLSHPKSKVLQVEAKVEKLLDYEYHNVGPMMNGAKLNGGLTAVLKVKNGIIVVTTERIQAYDINAFLGLGIDITIKQPLIIAIKSTAHFRASYTDLADEGIELVRGAGWSDAGFDAYNYKYRRYPLLPLDPITKEEWENI